MILLDLCDPAVSVDISDTLTDQTYTVTDNERTYTLPTTPFTVTPDFCNLDLTYTIGDISNLPGSSAITQDGQTFSF